jgi:hypothetical protein
MNEFFKIFNSALNEKIIDFTRVFAHRIKSEQESIAGTNLKTNSVINQCCNSIRTICESEEYINSFGDQIDQELVTIYDFMIDPSKIDFDDDIALSISTHINIRKEVTDIQKRVFTTFDACHQKYKGIFGNLVVAINSFIVYGTNWFNENPEAVKSLFSMAMRGLKYGDPMTGILTPCDGAIVFQVCLQYFKSPVFNDYFADALTNSIEIMKKFKDSENLRIVFLGTFLSAFIYSPEATLKYLESENILEAIFEELFINDSKMFDSYQKKLYLVGLGQMIFSEYLPEFVSNNLPKILSKMILMLGRLNLSEKLNEKRSLHDHKRDDAKEPIRKGSKTNKNKEELYPEDDDEAIEDELKEINDYYDSVSSGAFLGRSEETEGAPFVVQRVEHHEHEHKHEQHDHHHHSHDHDHHDHDHAHLDCDQHAHEHHAHEHHAHEHHAHEHHAHEHHAHDHHHHDDHEEHHHDHD